MIRPSCESPSGKPNERAHVTTRKATSATTIAVGARSTTRDGASVLEGAPGLFITSR